MKHTTSMLHFAQLLGQRVGVFLFWPLGGMIHKEKLMPELDRQKHSFTPRANFFSVWREDLPSCLGCHIRESGPQALPSGCAPGVFKMGLGFDRSLRDLLGN